MPTSSHCSGCEFAIDFRKIGLFCRDDVGIVPYRRARRFSAKTDNSIFDSLAGCSPDGGTAGFVYFFPNPGFLLAKAGETRYDKIVMIFCAALRAAEGVSMSADILSNIQNDIHAFSKGQKKIASYILSNYD